MPNLLSMHEAAPVLTVNRWDKDDVKRNLDEMVRYCFMSLKPELTEDFRLVDSNMMLAALGVGVAVFGVLWDWIYPFPDSREVLGPCVFIYFLILAALTYHTYLIKRDIFYVGAIYRVAAQNDEEFTREDWKIFSRVRASNGNYWFKIAANITKENSRRVHEEISVKSCANYIDTYGNVLVDPVMTEVRRVLVLMADLDED